MDHDPTDGLAIKVGEGGRVVNGHGLIAVGVNTDGHREILRLDRAWMAPTRGGLRVGEDDIGPNTSRART